MRVRLSKRRAIGASIFTVTLVIGAACGGSPDIANDGDTTITGGTSAGGSATGGSAAGGSLNLDGGGTGGGGSGGFSACGDGDECNPGLVCKHDVCVPDLGPCSTNDDCPGDSYCDADDTCVPYGVPPDVINDPSCQRGEAPDGVQPVEQCGWNGPEDGPDADFKRVYTTPLVADLNLDQDPNRLQPSVILTTWNNESGERIGILRLFDGRTCEQQMSLGSPTDEDDADRPGYGSQLAVGDLDGDLDSGGHPEIVGLHRTPGPFGDNNPLQPIAWQIVIENDTPRLETLWHGRVCDAVNGDTPITFGNSWLEFGPGLWDIDDDGVPEVIIDQYVFDANGCVMNDTVINDTANVDKLYDPYLTSGNNHKGVISTIADVDLDGDVELVRYDGIYRWENDDWVLEDYVTNWTGNSADKGHVAVADMGEYSAITGHPATDALPEIIVVSAEGNFNPESTGSVRVMALDGSIVYSRSIPHQDGCTDDDNPCFGGHGGPPTASDFDSDGQIEFAAAANIFYTVYDPDCDSGGVPSERPGGACDNGSNPLPPAGQQDGILWAQQSQDFSSSQTGSSIFDFDGDGQAEAVYRDECYLRVYDGATGEVVFSAPATSGTGSEYPTIMDVDGDFATEIVVARAGGGGSCPETDPLVPDSTTTLESAFGFVILRDPEDLWVSSRPIWNQHAYSITHVSDNATVHATSDTSRNWEVEGLNNFRQNTQGELGLLDLADLTVELQNLSGLCTHSEGELDLEARVCNRGTNPVQDGAEVAFYHRRRSAGPDDNGTLICSAATETLLGVGDCTVVSCSGEVPANRDVFVIVDPEGNIADCHPGNNDGASSSALCPVVQ